MLIGLPRPPIGQAWCPGGDLAAISPAAARLLTSSRRPPPAAAAAAAAVATPLSRPALPAGHREGAALWHRQAAARAGRPRQGPRPSIRPQADQWPVLRRRLHQVCDRRRRLHARGPQGRHPLHCHVWPRQVRRHQQGAWFSSVQCPVVSAGALDALHWNPPSPPPHTMDRPSPLRLPAAP